MLKYILKSRTLAFERRAQSSRNAVILKTNYTINALDSPLTKSNRTLLHNNIG